MANVLRLWRQRTGPNNALLCERARLSCTALVELREPASTRASGVNITVACKSPERVVRFMAELTAGRSPSGLQRVPKRWTHVRGNCAPVFSNEPDGVCGGVPVSGRHLWRLLWSASLGASASSPHTFLLVDEDAGVHGDGDVPED